MRRVTSLILVIAGTIELVTGIVLYIIPSGRVAYWSNYHLMGLSKTQWGNIHITVGFLVVAAAMLHMSYNWNAIDAYLRNTAKKMTVFNRNFNIAFVVCLYVTVGTLFRLPPMNFVLDIGEHFTNKGNVKYGEPPYGHAELSSLKMFCSKMNLDPAKAKGLLEKAGITVESAKVSIAEIAKRSGRTPQDIYEIIKSAAVMGEGGKSSFPATPMPGFGMKTIGDICTAYKLPVDEVIKELKKAGLEVKPDDAVKDIASENAKNPMAIFELLKEIAER